MRRVEAAKRRNGGIAAVEERDAIRCFRRDATGACTYGNGRKAFVNVGFDMRRFVVYGHIKEQKFYTDAESRVVRLRASGKVPPCGGNFSVARRGKRLGIELHFQGSRRARVRVRAVRENGSLGRMVRRGIPSDDGLWQCRAKRGNGYAFCHATIGMSEPRGRSVSVGILRANARKSEYLPELWRFPEKNSYICARFDRNSRWP